jgi:hypothetical protein
VKKGALLVSFDCSLFLGFQGIEIIRRLRKPEFSSPSCPLTCGGGRTFQMPLDLLKLASCWDAGKLGSSGSLAVQIGGLQLQGAVFDGQRFSELTQVRMFVTSAER